MHRIIFAVPALLALAACGGTPEPTPVARDFTLIAQGAQTPQSRLYADCIAQAARQGTYGRSADETTELVRFNCDGAPARAFYEALDGWSVQQDSRWESNGWSYRSTNRIVQNLFGADWCGTDGRDGYACVVNLNVGNFGRPG